MTTARASIGMRAGGRGGLLARLPAILLPLATGVGLLGLALLVLLLPAYMHPALDAAGAPRLLGVSAAEAHRLSDQTVRELLLGPGTFQFAGPAGDPFYDSAEQGHLRDVRLVLYGFVLLAAVAGFGVVLAGWRGRSSPATWRAIARGGAGLAVGLTVVGIFALVAFNLAFELFHRLLFPGGNWAFDPQSQRLVQLYPLAFWQITAAVMGLIGIACGLAVWALARRRARRLAGAK